MNPRAIGIALLAAFALATLGRAGDKDAKKGDDGVSKALSEIADLGPGVHKIKKDANGHIVSCVVVGQSRVSTVLGRAKGLETARLRASLGAKAEFVKWLKEKVRVREGTDDEEIVLLEGSEPKDGEPRESGKAVEKTSKKMEAVAEGMVRGLQLLHKEVAGTDKTYTLVYGWDAKAAEATKKVRENLNDESKDGTTPKVKDPKVMEGRGEADKPAVRKPDPDKKIDDSKATSKDAKKFLDD